MRVTISRKAHFNAAHRLYRKDWSFEQNDAVFGKCNNPNFHGHNYELIVKLVGEINPDTGYVYDMKDLSALIKTHVLDKFDHKNLNLDTVEFKTLNPSWVLFAREPTIWFSTAPNSVVAAFVFTTLKFNR